MSDADVHTARFTGYDVVRILLGLALLTAAGLKGHQLATEPTLATGVLDSRWFLVGLVEFELLFGLWLIANIHPRLSWGLVLACFACFGSISGFKALSGETSCGCFGRVAINPWYTLAIDVLAVLALLRWRPIGVSSRGVASMMSARFRLVSTATVWGVVSAPLLVVAGSYEAATVAEAGEIVGNSRFVVLEPETWVGGRFPLLEYSDIGDRLAEGEWTVFLYHHDCPKCLDVLPHYEQLANDVGGPGVALLEIPPFSSESAGTNEVSSAALRGQLSETREWLVETPARLDLSRSVVIYVE